MQPERQIAIACIALSAIIVVPEALRLLQYADAAPGGALLAGGLLGALGVFFGALMAWGRERRAVRGLLLSLWFLATAALVAVLLFAAWRRPEFGWRTAFAAEAVLSLAVAAMALRRARMLQPH